MSATLKPLKWYKSLFTRKGRLSAGAFLVEGERAVRQVIIARPGDIEEILIVDDIPPVYSEFAVRSLNDSQFKSISTTRTPQGIAAVVKSPPGIYSDDLPSVIGDKILLLEDIQDPGNAGTLIRTAAAFGFSGVIMTEKSADPLSPKCVQSTAGSVLSLWIRRTSGYMKLIRQLQDNDYAVFAADLSGTEDPVILKSQKKLVLALGNEASGLSGELLEISEHRIRVPTIHEKAESLNVAACGAICMYLSSM
ncbi:MAG: RNA methyltransferase [Dehalococcoidales bacterium]|nr:MAG: RNA methyltransferase [Dehalococcoidales bacterium]